jgi:hypothetical protein
VKEIPHGRCQIFLSQYDLSVKVSDLRRCARIVVRIPAIVANKGGLTNCVVTNISESGCELQLVRSFLPSHYLILKIYPQDGTVAWQITLAEIRWVEKEWAGVKFVSLSQVDKAILQRLCSGQVAFPLG